MDTERVVSTGSQPKRAVLSSQWSLILRAQGTGPEARKALDALVRRYENSIVSLIRRRPYPPDRTPEDIKQNFVEKILERGDIGRLDRSRGRFRNWLRVAVWNFVNNTWGEWHAELGCMERIAEFTVSHPRRPNTPDDFYMRDFAEETMVYALGLLRDEWGNKRQFDELKRFLPGANMDSIPYAEVAESLGTTPNTVAVRVCQMRQRYLELLARTVADLLDVDPQAPGAAQEIELEIGVLITYFRDVPPWHATPSNDT